MKRNFISYEESQQRLSELKIRGGFERVPLQNGLNRVLAEDIIADENSPSAPTSSLDGYAIKVKDQNLESLKILSIDNPAGTKLDIELEDGYAIKTFTGSIMPKGSDTLIPVENVDEVEGRLFIHQKVSIGNGVRPVGEIYRQGDIILKKGTKLGYVEIGVLASLNIGTISVYQKPKVAILSTGSEILEVGEERKNSSQIRSSNNYTLEALVNQNGGETIQMGIVKDDRESLIQALRNGIDSKADFIVTTGGVSVGDYDFVTDVIEKVGFKKIFHGVKIKPGQHILLATNNNQILISLPGFAYSSTVTAILYLLPLIRYFIGQEFSHNIIQAVLKENYYKRSKKSEFTACNLSFNNGTVYVDFQSKKVGTSAILTNMLNSANLLFSDEDSGDIEVGKKANIIIL